MVEYRAGVCNISETERKKRKFMGAASFLNSMIVITVLFLFPSFTPLYAAIFLLNFTGFLGFLQSRYRFCTGLALKKKSFTEDSAKEVEDSEKINEDRKKAASIIFQSLIGSTFLTTAIYLIAASF